jgi:predicted transcriptional regulator
VKNLTGAALRQVRKEIGLTQVNIAKLCRVTNTYIRMVETGCAKPTNHMENKILEALGIWVITTDYLKGIVK